jgi:hypothetical protein
MILALCPCPESEVVITATELVMLSHQRIDAVPDDTFDEELLLELDSWEETEQQEPDFEKARGTARAALHAELDRLFRYPEDVAVVTINGRNYWATGGLSWGDAPTDAYSILNVFAQLGLFDEPVRVRPDSEQEQIVEVRPVTDRQAIVSLDELLEWRRLVHEGITDAEAHIALVRAITGAIRNYGGEVPDEPEVVPYDPILAVSED